MTYQQTDAANTPPTLTSLNNGETDLSLFQLVYVSTINVPESEQEQALKDIILKAQKYNEKNDLTGMLFFTGQYFVQYLEGDRGKVSATFEKILLDDRHMNVQVAYADNRTKRQFPHWSMSLVRIRKQGDANLAAQIRQAPFNPYELDGLTIRNLTLTAFESLSEEPITKPHYID